MLNHQTLDQLRVLHLDGMVAALQDQATTGVASELRSTPAQLASFGKRLAQLARTDLIVIDDLAIAPITEPERNDLLELLDDRVGTRATLITSQLPVTKWHTWLEEPTIADAIMDRIVHRAHKITLKGESLR